jgi:catechol 2,3-dioxygenase-like lactoylglutathione lyase family enzyme
MIDGLHHISLALLDLEAGIRAYRELLGREPTMRTAENGVCCAYFRLENTALRIVAPSGDSSKAEHIRQRLGTDDQGALFGLAFEVADADQARRHLKRISLWPDTAGDIEVRDMFTPNVVAAWRQITLENRSTDSVDIELVQPVSALPASNSLEDAPVLQADLVVVRTTEPERALAFYGARLNLKLIFDRTNADTGNRLAQFRAEACCSRSPTIPEPTLPVNRTLSGASDGQWRMQKPLIVA